MSDESNVTPSGQYCATAHDRPVAGVVKGWKWCYNSIVLGTACNDASDTLDARIVRVETLFVPKIRTLPAEPIWTR